ERQVRVDTYILPLVNSSRYTLLRQMNLKPSRDDPARAPAGTLGRFQLGFGADAWFALNLAGDLPPKTAEWLVRRDMDPHAAGRMYGKWFWQLPLVLEIGDEDSASLERGSEEVGKFWAQQLKGGEPSESKHQGVAIRRRPID